MFHYTKLGMLSKEKLYLIELIQGYFEYSCRHLIHNTSFYSLLMNGPNKLECCLYTRLERLARTNTLAYWAY
jgi:hypothetical protein